jgi:RNA polymerase sigma-70 factor (ECF subfamily)
MPSPQDNSLEKYLDYATRYAKRKANQLVDHFGFSKSDRADIVQELMLDLVRRWSKFDPSRGKPQVFIRRVLWARVSTLIKEKRALKRQFDFESAPLTEADNEVTTSFRSGLPERIDQEYADLAFDVATVLAELSDEDRDLCERLQSQPLAEIARELGIARSTLADRVQKLRCRFEQAGLQHYFQPEFR